MKQTLKITFINTCIFAFIVVSVFAYIMYQDKQEMVKVVEQAVEERDNCAGVMIKLIEKNEEWRK